MRSVPRSEDTSTTGVGARVAAIVRAEVLWSAIGALLLCYFGFVYFAGGTTPGTWLFFHTLRIGGVAMAVSTLLLGSGRPFALAVDGVAAAMVGLAMAASGVLMLRGGGLQAILNLVFGALFVSAGVRNFSMWQSISAMASRTKGAPAAGGYDPNFENRYAEVRARPPTGSLAGQLLERSRGGGSASEPTPEVVRPADASSEQVPLELPSNHSPSIGYDQVDGAAADDQPQGPPVEEDTAGAAQPSAAAPPPTPSAPAPPAADAPSGFLASFAEPDPDDDTDRS